MSIFHIASKSRVVSVVGNETIFNVALKISVIKVVNIKTIFHAVFNVSAISDEIVFRVVSNVGVVSY